ncbi:hypothetical protein REPUB_Repub12eG0062000 [Reevesia pubescens]
MVLSEFDRMSRPDSINLASCPFGVQVHGLTLGLMNDKVDHAIGRVLGHVEEVETKGDVEAWGRYLRIRVVIDTSKPLLRGTKVILLEQNGTINDSCEGASLQSSGLKGDDRRHNGGGKGRLLENRKEFSSMENQGLDVVEKINQGDYNSCSLRVNDSQNGKKISRPDGTDLMNVEGSGINCGHLEVIDMGPILLNKVYPADCQNPGQLKLALIMDATTMQGGEVSMHAKKGLVHKRGRPRKSFPKFG